MKYIIVNTFKVVPVQDDVYNKVVNYLRFRGYTCHEAVKPPAKRTLRRWMQQGLARAICGCWVGTARGTRCEAHNVMSWLTVLQRKHRSN